MTTPSKPIRKGPGVNPSPVGNGVTGGKSIPMPTRKSATPFGSVSRESVLPRSNSGITPGGVPTNDKDAGKGTGNVR